VTATAGTAANAAAAVTAAAADSASPSGASAESAAAAASPAGRPAGPPAANGAAARQHRLELVVVGAHLSGMALNHELTSLGGRLVRCAATAPEYHLFALPGGAGPARPGLLRVGEDDGAAIEVEVWSLAREAFAAFVAEIRAPLGIGTVRLADGTSVQGFLVEAIAVKGARSITHFGGWRRYIAAGAQAATV
jgi:allophanate hydrolase